ETADRALPYAKSLAEGGKLIAVHCKELFIGGRAGGYPVLADEDELEAKIHHQVEELRAEGIDASDQVITAGGAGSAHVIADAAAPCRSNSEAHESDDFGRCGGRDPPRRLDPPPEATAAERRGRSRRLLRAALRTEPLSALPRPADGRRLARRALPRSRLERGRLARRPPRQRRRPRAHRRAGGIRTPARSGLGRDRLHGGGGVAGTRRRHRPAGAT